MTADEIADCLVPILRDVADLPLTCTVEKPEDIATVDAEHDGCRVFVVAKDEQEEAIGDGDNTCARTRVVSVAVNGPLRIASRSNYLKLVEQLRIALEGTQFERYFWSGNDVISLWDREALRVRKRFLALFEATYTNIS